IAETLQFIGAVPMVHYSDTSSVRYFLLDNGVLSIKLQNFYGTANLYFDPRSIYDFEECSREFSLVDCFKENICTLRCRILGKQSYDYFVSIHCKQDFEFDFDCIKEDLYPLEKSRSSSPDRGSILGCMNVDFHGDGTLYIASGRSQQESEDRLQFVLQDRSEQLRVTVHNNQQFNFDQTTHVDLLNQAYQSAKISLSSLCVDQDIGGIYAGLPWFFHWWTRDEAISLGAFLELKDYQYVKKILLKQTENFLQDGRISCRFPKMDLASADSTGWCATRLLQLLYVKSSVFSKKELQSLYDVFTHNVALIENNYLKDDLISSGAWESWMDTGDQRDKRNGFLIEIQLLHQRIHDAIDLLAKLLKITNAKVDRLGIIRDRFFKSVLIDRLDPKGNSDLVARPNVFISYYVYHQLLTKEQWESCFDHLIDRLWLDWGGFASIEIDSELYLDTYTGETNDSYHRGDSWYYLNNMAAICMKHLNHKKYKIYIDQIMCASSNEIVFMGASGHHAEVSSASNQESQGCLAQAWSASMFIELFATPY
ncbi:hypothetical protein MJH12_12160, partial [bacterium]|nr:hypothetical protein [bacterium]